MATHAANYLNPDMQWFSGGTVGTVTGSSHVAAGCSPAWLVAEYPDAPHHIDDIFGQARPRVVVRVVVGHAAGAILGTSRQRAATSQWDGRSKSTA